MSDWYLIDIDPKVFAIWVTMPIVKEHKMTWKLGLHKMLLLM